MNNADTDCEAWIGRTLIDVDGRRIGPIEDVYCNKETREQLWMVVKAGRFAAKRRFVPIAGALEAGDAVRTPHAKRAVEAAPAVDASYQLADEAVRSIYRHYAMPLDGAPPHDEPAATAPAAAPEPVAEPKPAPAAQEPPEAAADEEPDDARVADRILRYLT